MKKLFLAAFSLIVIQGSANAQLDSLKIFSLDDYLDLVLNYHPVVRQAELLDELAQTELLYARGFFDPKIESEFQTKRFDEKQYYRLLDNVLKIPVWTNTDLKLGYERNSGSFLNEENTLPENGLLYGGISLPVGRGLFIDERRAAVKQARLMQDMANAEKVKMINKIFLTAIKDYWSWFNAYQNLQILQDGVRLAEVRFRAIKQNVLLGDYAPIDSVEAKITLQNRLVEANEANLDLENTRLILSNHLWNKDSEPLELSPEAQPVWFGLTVIPEKTYFIEEARLRHPELQKLGLKLQTLEIDRKLQTEFLKPEININYNFLNLPAISNDNGREGGLFTNDYKFGMEFAFPIFLRKERAKLRKTNLKLVQTNYELSQSRQEILNTINTSYNSLTTFYQQLDLQEDMVQNYQRLLNAEILNFNNGLSSLFLVNTRETKLLEARAKLVDLQTKTQKSLIQLYWASGVPLQQINQ